MGWADLVRSIVDNRYFLKQFVAEEDGAGVFVAADPDNAPVEVRLAPLDAGKVESWRELVDRSRETAHPNLLRYLAAGESRIDGKLYGYIATEPVQERLQDVLAARTLEVDEARFVTESLMSAVDHLHQRGFMHGALVPASIVAAGDSVKLLIGTVRKLPSDELDMRRAVTADLREFAETTLELLTGKRDIGAGANLPSPFREFVRASFGTEECPSPTAAQLIGVLNGKPLSAPKPPPAAPTPVVEPKHEIEAKGSSESRAVVMEIEPEPVLPPPPPPPPAVHEPRRFKPGMATVAIAGLVVLALALAAFWSIAGRASEEPVRTRANDAPAAAVSEPVRPTFRPPAARSAPAPAKTPTGQWAVVAAAYGNYDAALKRAQALSARWKSAPLSVFPERGKGSRYLVIVASGLTQKEARQVRTKALRAGLPRDSYVTRLRL